MSDRALIIKKRWLDLILEGKKTWEIRGSDTNIRGKIFLAESGTGLIVGECELVNSFSLLDEWIKPEALFKKHRVDDWGKVVKYINPHAWVLARAKRYKKPCPYIHPNGAVIWVKI